MKRFKNLLLLFTFLGLVLIITTPAMAEITVTAKHEVLSEVVGSNGLFEISLDITIQNTSIESLSNVTLEIIGPNLMLEPDTNAVLLDSLPSGLQFQFTWNLTAFQPLFYGLPLHIIGTGTDINGVSVEFFIISEEVVTQ